MIKCRSVGLFFAIGLLLAVLNFCQTDAYLPPESLLDSENDYSDLLADLDANPIILNIAGISDLMVIPWLAENEAKAVIDYRRRKGGLKNIDELSQMTGLDQELIESLRPYIVVRQPLSLVVKSRTRLKQKTRLEKEQLPHSLSCCQRLSLSAADRYELGLLLEKDPEERDLADFATGYFQIDRIAGIDQLVVGDFRPGFAQGLVFSRWSFSISAPKSLKKKDSRSIGYLSSVENGALRGVFLKKSLKTLQGAVFFSRNRLDGSLNEDGTVKTLLTTGYHITASEIAKKDLVSEKVAGCRILGNFQNNFKLGTSFVFSSFTPAFVNYDTERKRYAFTGSDNSVWGVDWDVTWPNLNLYGEAACSKSGGKACLLGASSKIRGVKLSTVARSYGRDFHSFHGSAFSASGQLYNEVGIFAALFYSPAKGTDLLAYVDQYRHPSRRYYEPVPTRGDKWGLVASQEFSRQVAVAIDLRTKYGQKGSDVLGRRNSRIRLDASWNVNKKWRLRSRAEKVFVDFEDSRWEQGISAFLDLRIKPTRFTTVSGRLTAFDTDSYESRIYEFETDHPGAAYSRFIYGKGHKWYLLVAQEIGNGDLSVKYRSQKSPTGKKGEFSLQFDAKMD